jgi:hypoxia-inducible factor 1-alpha inhibitor (HIF hydroxylase)
MLPYQMYVGAELFQDVFPLEPMMVLPENYKVEDGHLHRKTYVWAGSAGAITPLHYDLYHNFYQQLDGWKYFLLFPPTEWEKIYLYPILHPGGRSSQVDLSKEDPTQVTPLCSASLLNSNIVCLMFDA